MLAGHPCHGKAMVTTQPAPPPRSSHARGASASPSLARVVWLAACVRTLARQTPHAPGVPQRGHSPSSTMASNPKKRTGTHSHNATPAATSYIASLKQAKAKATPPTLFFLRVADPAGKVPEPDTRKAGVRKVSKTLDNPTKQMRWSWCPVSTKYSILSEF